MADNNDSQPIANESLPTTTKTAASAVAVPVMPEEEHTIRRGLDVIQSMIDIAAIRLDALRTRCATSSELTQQEIRTLETKLVRKYSELLVIKAKLPERLPMGAPTAMAAELEQWLQIIGLSPLSVSTVLQHVPSLDILLEKSDEELRDAINHNATVRDVEVRRLVHAMNNLKLCHQAMCNGEKEPPDLFWGSWDRHHHTQHHRPGTSPRPHRNLVVTSAAGHRVRTEPSAVVVPVMLSPEKTRDQPNRAQTISPEQPSTLSPSPSPPSSPSVNTFVRQQQLLQHHQHHQPPIERHNASGGSHRTFPTTPPPRRKHQTTYTGAAHINTAYLINAAPAAASPSTSSSDAAAQQQLPKSKSHEAQLLAAAAVAAAANTQLTPRSRLHTEPTPADHDPSAAAVEGATNYTLPPVPRSPCTPGLAFRNPSGVPVTADATPPYQQPMHGHRFYKKFKLIATCDQCCKQMFFGLKCKECKFRCHKDCEYLVRSTCSAFLRQLTDLVFSGNSSPTMLSAAGAAATGSQLTVASTGGAVSRSGGGSSGIGPYHIRRDRKRSQDCGNGAPGDGGGSESSCNSSTPSSPAPLQHGGQQATPVAAVGGGVGKTQFKFPEVSHIYKPDTVGGITLETHLIRQEKQLQQQQQHQQHQQHHLYHHHQHGGHHHPTVPTSPRHKLQAHPHDGAASTDGDRAEGGGPHPLAIPSIIREEGQDDSFELGDSTGSDQNTLRLDESDERMDAGWSRQNSVSLKEWDIPFEDILVMEQIGVGRFGTVHRAQWHGAVAIKILKEDYLDNEAFKVEVATFKKTRHENVVLFMGACIVPQAIVTSLCKGNTLYTHIHVRKDRFNLTKTTMVAQQISLGMGYLHARSITHKDLKTKNIFLENGKVIITDFGLFSATKLEYNPRLGLAIPKGWLAYLAPEIMQSLTPYPPEHRDSLPFTKKSDIFAFGTIWYELLCSEMPFKMQPPEAIIFQVGRGMKQSLANLQAARDVKEILMTCWSFDYNVRPDFSQILQQLEKLPLKRLARSPSHPVQLSRSAESVF